MLDYLTGWNELLWQIYPDYKPSGTGNLLGGTVAIDQPYIMQMLVADKQSRRAAAANDNDAWRGAAFSFVGGTVGVAA